MIRIDFGLVVLTLYRAEGSGVKVQRVQSAGGLWAQLVYGCSWNALYIFCTWKQNRPCCVTLWHACVSCMRPSCSLSFSLSELTNDASLRGGGHVHAHCAGLKDPHAVMNECGLIVITFSMSLTIAWGMRRGLCDPFAFLPSSHHREWLSALSFGKWRIGIRLCSQRALFLHQLL